MHELDKVVLVHEIQFPMWQFLVRHKLPKVLVDHDDTDWQYQQIVYDVFDREYRENQDDQHQVPIHRKEHDQQIDQDHEFFAETKVLNKNILMSICMLINSPDSCKVLCACEST